MLHHDAAIALGSNMGDRAAFIRRAAEALSRTPGVTVLRVSSPIETAPVRVPGSVGESGGAYLNAAAVLRTTLSARELLTRMLEIERELGRVREAGNRSAPRTIDLDLILFGDQVITEPGLEIPHPRMHERRFVLEPLASVAGEWMVPTIGKTVGELLAALDKRD